MKEIVKRNQAGRQTCSVTVQILFALAQCKKANVWWAPHDANKSFVL